MRTILKLASVVLLSLPGSMLAGQETPAKPPAGPMFPTAALVSPDVHPDRTVTFRFSAPGATAVALVGEINRGQGPQAMAKDSDGIWTITIGPLDPEIWIYNFRIQGVDVVDPSNPSIKPVPPDKPPTALLRFRERHRPSTTLRLLLMGRYG